MRSILGFWAGLVILLTIPITLVYQRFFNNGADTVTHELLAAGSLLLAFAVFDFDRVPKWITWIGCLAATGEGTIFLLQGLSPLIQNAGFTQLVFQGLGHWPERVLMDLIIVWCVALWLTASHGKTRLIGLLVLVSVIGLESYSYYASFAMNSINAAGPGAKLYLLTFAWLLLESSQRISPVLSSRRITIQQKETI